MNNDPRRGRYPYKKLRDIQRAKREPCAICGHPIDYKAKPRTPRSFSLDHITALAHGGDIHDPANVRSAHYGCNSRRGARVRQRTTPTQISPSSPTRRKLPEW